MTDSPVGNQPFMIKPDKGLNINDTSNETSGKIIAADGHEYHKSKTANATVAPTNQATIDKAEQKHLTPELLQLVTIIDYEWNLKGTLDLEAIDKEYGYEKGEVSNYLKLEVVLTALEERGINKKMLQNLVGLEPEQLRTAKLTPMQLIAANKLMDLTDTRSDRKKLQDLGISSTQYSAWIRDEDFRSYLQNRAEALIGDSQHDAMLALVDRVKSRDLGAIKYYHELTGRFTPVSAASQGNNSFSMETIVMRIIEIIIDEVHDPNVAAIISDRLKGLITGAQVAGVIAPPEVIVPEIAQPREVTPEVRHLMDQGLGYDQ